MLASVNDVCIFSFIASFLVYIATIEGLVF